MVRAELIIEDPDQGEEKVENMIFDERVASPEMIGSVSLRKRHMNKSQWPQKYIIVVIKI